MRAELKAAGGQVLSDAKRRLASTIGQNLKQPARSRGRAVGSLRVLSNNRGVFIAGGKATVPYFPWVEYGGTLGPAGKRHNTQHRPFLRSGRGIYPAINENQGHIRDHAEQAMVNAKRKAGL